MCRLKRYFETRILKKKVHSYLTMAQFDFNENTENREMVEFLYRLNFKDTKIPIMVGLSKTNRKIIDIVSVIRFAPEHMKIINKFSKKEKKVFSDFLIINTTLLEPEIIIVLKETQDKEKGKRKMKPYYMVGLPIYAKELSMNEFLRCIRQVHKSALLTKILIQQKL